MTNEETTREEPMYWLVINDKWLLHWEYDGHEVNLEAKTFMHANSHCWEALAEVFRLDDASEFPHVFEGSDRSYNKTKAVNGAILAAIRKSNQFQEDADNPYSPSGIKRYE